MKTEEEVKHMIELKLIAIEEDTKLGGDLLKIPSHSVWLEALRWVLESEYITKRDK